MDDLDNVHPELATLVHMPNPDDVFMKIRLRYPWHVDEAGLLVMHNDWLEWTAISFRHETECNHRETACNMCLADWFNGHVIELCDPVARLWIKLDEYWNHVMSQQGYQVPTLVDHLHDLDYPGTQD